MVKNLLDVEQNVASCARLLPPSGKNWSLYNETFRTLVSFFIWNFSNDAVLNKYNDFNILTSFKSRIKLFRSVLAKIKPRIFPEEENYSFVSEIMFIVSVYLQSGRFRSVFIFTSHVLVPKWANIYFHAIRLFSGFDRSWINKIKILPNVLNHEGWKTVKIAFPRCKFSFKVCVNFSVK